MINQIVSVQAPIVVGEYRTVPGKLSHQYCDCGMYSAVGAFTRARMREESFFRKILPPRPIIDDLVTKVPGRVFRWVPYRGLVWMGMGQGYGLCKLRADEAHRVKKRRYLGRSYQRGREREEPVEAPDSSSEDCKILNERYIRALDPWDPPVPLVVTERASAGTTMLRSLQNRPVMAGATEIDGKMTVLYYTYSQDAKR